MENFSLRPEDIRALIIGAFGSVLGGLLLIGMLRYWSYRSAKSIQRRIKQAEARKFTLDNLVKSDREILLLSFQILFFIAFICSLIFIVKIVILCVKNGWTVYYFIDLLMLAVTSLMSWVAFDTLSKVGEYPKSVERIDKKTESLKERLAKLNDK